MRLIWFKCEAIAGNQWCNFFNLNLEHAHFMGLSGVYIIWHAGQSPRTVYVGQGDIAARIAAHRKEIEILRYSNLGLYVTWAQVSAAQQDGIERYLAERLHPLVGGRYPQAAPITVNLPW